MTSHVYADKFTYLMLESNPMSACDLINTLQYLVASPVNANAPLNLVVLPVHCQRRLITDYP